MIRKDIFQNMSSWSQLFFLCLFSFVGLIFLSVLTVLFMHNDPTIVTNVAFLRISVAIQSCFVFLLPACLCAYLFYREPCSFLKIEKSIDCKFLILALVLIIAIQPIIGYTAYLNNAIKLPQSLESVQNLMRVWEDSAQALTEKLLITNSVWILLINILVIGVVAGVTEEFFFRGSIQQLINKITSNSHVAIWITAFIFSAIHFQFYGFIPRFLLGALLGYLFVWSGNLWISVIVHAANNTLSVLVFHFFHNSEGYDKIENIGTGDTWWTVIVSVFIVGLILTILSKESVAKKIEKDYNPLN